MPASRAFDFKQSDGKAVGRGAVVAAVGAAIVCLTQTTSEADFGVWTPFVTALASVLVNAIRKWLSDNRGGELR